MTRDPTGLHNRLSRELKIGLDGADFEILDTVKIASHDCEGWEPNSAAAVYRAADGVSLYLSFAIDKSGSDPEMLLRERIEHYRRLADETERLLRRYRELQVDAALAGVPDVPHVPGDEMPEDKLVTADLITSIDQSRQPARPRRNRRRVRGSPAALREGAAYRGRGEGYRAGAGALSGSRFGSDDDVG